MAHELNAIGQAIGVTVPNWTAPPWPPTDPMAGRFCRLELLNAGQHAADLFAANRLDADNRNWTYLPYGPFDTPAEYTAWVESVANRRDPQFWAIVDLASGKPVGVASYLRINPTDGSIEVGSINYSPLLQRKPAGTEAMYLMMQRAFELGYRRYEWKCNALNAPSRAAAQRLGLSYEGIFRQCLVVKGHNRDTAWYAAIDSEWPALDRAFTQWLDPSNFDQEGRQRVALGRLTSPILVMRG
ncbi:MAG: GNAT family N-acetyltransferase [Acidobacteriia bacterium]|nr:GNAT family N-acetyltransferase [Terriglobia bacterium]